MQPRAQALGLAALALASLASAQHRSPPPPVFAELRRNLPDLPWVSATELVDFDDDGDLDALIATHPPTWLQPELLLFENDGHAYFRRAASVFAVGKDPSLPWPQGPTYTYSPSVTDIAVADVDGDGDQDCLITLLYSGEFLVLSTPALPADGTVYAYEADLQLPQYSYLFRVVPADIDTDGRMDSLLQVSRSGGPSIQLARGIGGGRFAPSPELVVNDAYLGEVADVDGDGNVDVVFTPSTGGGARLLLGSHTGAFSSGPEFPNSNGLVTTGDIDLDLDLDLVFTGYPLHAVMNQGGGRFVEVFDRIPDVDQCAALELIDVDRDQDLDLALGSSVLLNDGDGFFSSSGGSYPTGPSRDRDASGLEAGDLDEDGDTDFLLVGSNRVLLGDGRGNYLDTSPPSRVDYRPGDLADLDGDGDVDALVVGQAYPQAAWSLLANDGRGEFERSDGAVPGFPYGGDAIFGDLDGDGDEDAFLRDGYRAFANDGHGRFTVLPSACLPAMQASPLDVALGDVDGDGDLDAVQGRGTADGPPRYDGGGAYAPWFLGMWRNDAQGCFAEATASLPGILDLGQGVALGDVDRDGDADVVTSYGTLFSNRGDGVFVDASPRMAALVSRSYQDVALGDLDGDGALDACFGGEIAWNDGQGSFPVSTPLDYYAWRVALGDLNDDGRLDVVAGSVVHSYLRGPVLTFVELQVNQGNRAFRAAPFPLTDRFQFALDDLDGDGDLDFFDGRRTFFNLDLSLAYRSAPRIGHPVVLEIHGRPRAPYFLLASRGLRPALPTPFGAWHLDPTRIVLRRQGALDASGAAEIRFDVPRLPALIGLTLYWQALSGLRPRLTGFERTSLTGY